MKQPTRLDRVRFHWWRFLGWALPTAWLWEHGATWVTKDDGYTDLNLWGWLWLTVLSSEYYYEELVAGRIPDGAP